MVQPTTAHSSYLHGNNRRRPIPRSAVVAATRFYNFIDNMAGQIPSPLLASPIRRLAQNLASTFFSVSCSAQSLDRLLLRTAVACAAVNPLASTAGL